MDSISPNQGQIVLRNYEAEFGDGSTMSNFGLINEIKLNYKPVAEARDSKGRTFAPGYDVTIEFSMMQTAASVLTSVFNSMTSDEPNVLRLKKGNTGFEFSEVKPIFTPEMDGNGGISKIKVKADKILTNAEMANIIYSG